MERTQEVRPQDPLVANRRVRLVRQRYRICDRHPTNNDLMLQTYPDAMQMLHAIGSAILQPGHFYCEPHPEPGGCPPGKWRWAETMWTILLYLAIAGLAVRLRLLLSALGGLWLTALFFQLIYRGFYRHQAIWIIFLITLYWFAFASREQSYA